MKLLSGFVSLAILSATIVSSIPITRRGVDEALVPQFGITAGVNPTGTGDCDGAVNGADGQPIKIPCSCPPDRAAFIQSLNANVAAGQVVNNPSVSISFPEDDSVASQLTRVNAATVTLQNLNGPGQGCPVASTTFQAQAAAINSPRVVRPILMARDSESAPYAIGPLGGILKARTATPTPAPTPAPTPSPTPAPAPTPTPIPAFSSLFPPIVEDILKVRNSEPAPPTISFLEDILKARDSESASSPTISLVVFGDILARQSTPPPSPKQEIIITGPHVIEDIL